MIMMRRATYNIMGRLFEFCLCFGVLSNQCFSMQCGRWISDVADKKRLEQYAAAIQSLNLKDKEFKDKNVALILKDNGTTDRLIVSGMFPFSFIYSEQGVCLIDLVLPNDSNKAKGLNCILSSLSRAKIAYRRKGSEDVKKRIKEAQEIIEKVNGVLDGTKLYSDFNKKLSQIAQTGQVVSLKSEIAQIQEQLLIYYKSYRNALVEYFETLKIIAQQLEGKNSFWFSVAIDDSIQELNGIKETLDNASTHNFTDAIAQFQSQKKFQNNAHKIVHSENILLYLLEKKRLVIAEEGIRFFTNLDMCDACEDLIYKYAHFVEKAQFIVLSKKEFKKSRNRDNNDENILLKYHLMSDGPLGLTPPQEMCYAITL